MNEFTVRLSFLTKQVRALNLKLLEHEVLKYSFYWKLEATHSSKGVQSSAEMSRVVSDNWSVIINSRGCKSEVTPEPSIVWVCSSAGNTRREIICLGNLIPGRQRNTTLNNIAILQPHCPHNREIAWGPQHSIVTVHTPHQTSIS